MDDQANRWLELSADVPREDVEAAEDALLAAGALSVTLADAADAPVLEPGPGETPLWPAVTVKGLFPGERDALDLLARLSGSRPGRGWRVSGLADRAWEREWLRDFHPTRFGRRLWVVPSTSPPPQDGLHIRLDPGLAFGTGTHPTTALCLEWLDTVADASPGLAGRLVVDYGCGSGILAIAALRLGAVTAIAVDNDPQALIATRENALANEVSERLACCAPAGLAADLAGRRADVLVANILAGPLVSLIPDFARILAPGGRMALSGILSGQQAPVLAACRDGFHMDAPAEKAGWVRLQGTRKET